MLFLQRTTEPTESGYNQSCIQRILSAQRETLTGQTEPELKAELSFRVSA